VVEDENTAGEGEATTPTKASGSSTRAPTKLYGEWQTEALHQLEGAENGRIPRTPYGNVEVLSEEMLPPGTVLHNPLPSPYLHGLLRVVSFIRPEWNLTPNPNPNLSPRYTCATCTRAS